MWQVRIQRTWRDLGLQKPLTSTMQTEASHLWSQGSLVASTVPQGSFESEWPIPRLCPIHLPPALCCGLCWAKNALASCQTHKDQVHEYWGRKAGRCHFIPQRTTNVLKRQSPLHQGKYHAHRTTSNADTKSLPLSSHPKASESFYQWFWRKPMTSTTRRIGFSEFAPRHALSCNRYSLAAGDSRTAGSGAALSQISWVSPRST